MNDQKHRVEVTTRSVGPRLIVLEGIDLSGRTTQVRLLNDWLSAEHYQVTTTAWRTSPLISDLLARVRTQQSFQPLTYSLLYCSDHLDRTQRVIKPALEQGGIVLADRYTYTAFARDAARGLDPAWVRSLYRFSIQPDIVFYLHISPEEAVKRRLALQQERLAQSSIHAKTSLQIKKQAKRLKTRKQNEESVPNNQQTRATPALQAPPLIQETLESFRNFEKKMYSEYEQMRKEFNFSVIDGNEPIEEVQETLRRAVTQLLVK